MRVLISRPFQESLNNLVLHDRQRCQGYLVALFDWLLDAQKESDLFRCPLSNFFVGEEHNASKHQYQMKLRLYQINFDGFRLYISVKGKSTPIITFEHIEIAP